MLGKVIIAGAGIGSAKNLTLAVKEALDEAEVIIYDRLLNPEIIEDYQGKKELLYVGKKAGNHSLEQEEINRLMVERARAGKKVVRLKGGDPYVFGRGGEEVLYLREQGLDFEVLPGLSAGTVCLNTAGFPATHRDLATSVSFITGHRKKGVVGTFHQYAKLEGTLVFYMGLNSLEKIVRDLIAGGMSPQRPIGIIQNGAYNSQKTLFSTLEKILDEPKLEEMSSPALIVVGEVINLRNEMDYFTRRPLFGVSIGLTRALKQAGTVRARLDELGAVTHLLPTIELSPSGDEELNAAVQEDYSHLVLTSVNAVERFFSAYLARRDIRDLAGTTIAVVGRKTAKAVEKYHLKADICPEVYQGEALIEAIRPSVDKGSKILFPHSAKTRPELISALAELGDLREFAVYENHVPTELKPLPDDLEYMLFTSSSTVENFVKIYGTTALKNSKIISIGEICSRSIKKLGLELYAQSPEATIDSLIETIKEDVYAQNAQN